MCIYACVCVCVCVCIYIYIYIGVWGLSAPLSTPGREILCKRRERGQRSLWTPGLMCRHTGLLLLLLLLVSTAPLQVSKSCLENFSPLTTLLLWRTQVVPLVANCFDSGSFYCYRNASEREGKADVTFSPNLYTIGSGALFFSCFFFFIFFVFLFKCMKISLVLLNLCFFINNFI